MGKKVTAEQRQITKDVIMIRPYEFGFNPETAENNTFQNNESDLSKETIAQLAKEEFDELVSKLRSAGIRVLVFEDTEEPFTSDAIFPNNWISLHSNGMVISYPMYAPTRRLERRPDIIQDLSDQFHVNKDYTFEHYEEDGLFLEGTGSMVLDRINKIAYAALSPRTNIALLNKWCVLMDYKKVNFRAVDKVGVDIYHTNVMMAMGLDFVVICLESVQDETEKKQLLANFKYTNKEIIEISLDQMEAFSGNVLQLEGMDNETYLVMSETAFKSLRQAQVQKIKKHTNILTSAVSTIEKFGGGSVRCMIAENFLPHKN
jgi:hypothetical protein